MKRWMNADEDMKKRMNSIRFLVVILALMFGAVSGAWAQLNVSDIEIEKKPNASAGNIEPSVNGREVTLTVTPAAGYYIKASDIVVEKLVNTGKANAPKHRTAEITDVITGKMYSGAGRTDADIISSVENPNSAQYVFTLPADYDGAYVTATFHLEEEGDIIRINRNTSLGENPNMNKHYVLIEDVSATVVDVFYSKGTFTGTFEGEPKADGSFPTISGLEHALFQTVDGGTVKNIVLDNVTIAGSTYYTSVTVGNQSKKATGAIANVATGASRIYNCGVQATGSSVTTDKDGYTLFSTTNDAEGEPQHTESSSTVSGVDYVGGLVGFLNGTARVINCYSYADITSGSNVGGIVGWNNYKTKATDLQTMVMNCMFYGNLTSENKAPIYNGEIITNRSDQSGVSNFNYFWAGAPYVQIRNNINTYNCALSAETRYLQRFEFFRHLLNGHRELAAWWVQGAVFEKDEMAKWVMEPSQIGTTTPYPILKAQGKYPSVVNYEPSDETIDANNEHYNEGRKLGTLSVTIRMGTNSPFGAPSGARLKSGQSMTLALPITDKDPAHFNFNYGKVQLPYYNDYGIGNYTGNRVVTGWKIVSISGGTHGFSTGDDATASVNDNGDITLTTPYNFADRKCTEKDKFDVSGRVFSQGAYFDVPEGVSSIIIEPYWAKAVFVADDYRDVVCNQAMNAKSGIGTVGGGQWFDVGSGKNVSHDFTFAGEGTLTLTVHNTIANAVATLFSGESTAEKKVYDYAVVLVGNVHNLDISNKEKTKPYTIMSIDLDKDNEPDYSYILRFNSRVRVHPVRVDFLNIPGLGMAQKSTGGTGTYNFGIMQTYGWFESTSTSLFRVTQFEYDYVDSSTSGSNREDSPMILQGGVIEQWVTVGGAEDKHKEAESVTYYHVGGNVWFKEFHIGVHQDKNNSNNKDQFVSKHPPISVTGGDYNEFYLTGLYNTPNNNYNDNAECYINGGRFNKVAGTGMQGIGNLSTHENGNITWQIDNADINEFYGGGINAAHISEGNIMTVISNSRVDQFCGGPKFGNMNSDKKVATNATNCIFRTFFGAGYGGNSYNRRYPSNKNSVQNIDWDSWVSSEYTNKYDSDYGGVETRIDYQFIPMSDNASNVARLFVDYVSFSLATTHDVTSKLTDCTITTQPLGSLELFSQSVGNFYGGGNLGMVDGPVKSTLTNCTVEGNVFGGGYSATLPSVAVMNNSFQTEPFYDTNLGAYLDAKLPTTVAYTWEHVTEAEFSNKQIDTDNHILYTTEDLTGLGAVTGNVTLTIDGNTTLTNGKVMSVAKSVYGGGEESNVEGNTSVNITGGTITQNVFGGGKGEADEFSCSKAMIGVNNAGSCEDPGSEANKDKGTTVTISNGQVNGNVYGGGEVGRVEWNTQVKIGVGTGNGPFAPVIEGSVFGAGKGKDTHGYAALVRGNSTVTIQGNAKVKANVYGGGEQSTVGRYWVKGILTTLCSDETAIPTAPEGLPNEMPYKTRRGGNSTVIIQGSAQIGPDDAANISNEAGHVFGAGKGVTPNYVHTGDKANWSRRMVDYNSEKHTGTPGTTWDYYPDDHSYVWEYFATEDKYLEFLQTLALVTGTDVTIGGGTVKGNVYGGSESGFVQDDTDVEVSGGTIGTEGTTTYGNVFGGGKGLPTFAEAGKVKGNATVAVSNGTIKRNVYGGGELGHVGTFTETADGRYVKNDHDTGLCTVSITGGKIGPDDNLDQEIGNVFGAGKGKDDTFKCEKAMTMETSVSVCGGTVKGNVYGGGEVGRVEYDTEVTIGRKSNETAGSGTGTPIIYGSVFGAGRGVATHGYSALVRGNTRVDVEGAPGAMVKGSVFGGGEIASVGRYGLNAENMPNILLGGGECVVNVQGSVEITGNVFGAGQGVDPSTFNATGTDKTKLSRRMTVYTNSSEFKDDHTTKTGTWELYDGSVTPNIIWEYYGVASAYSDYLQTLALVTAPNVTIDGNAQVKGSVFGGGELGLTKGSVTVTIQNGTIGTLDTSGNPVAGTGDVYGGGSLANTNTTHYVGLKNADESPKYVEEEVDGKTIKYIETKEVHPTTIVRLTGGEVYGDAYGGGLGRLSSGDVTAVEAKVVGDVLVDLNGTTTVTTDADGGRTWIDNTGTVIDPVKKGCIIRRVFGGNNLNGTPQKNVTVHVYATQNANATQIANTAAVEASGDNPAVPAVENAKVKGRYDITAVYGGGNEAAYIPETPYTSTTPNGSKSQVIIDGCDYSSIETVYGGGNAAPVPESNVEIRAAYEIGYVFGGGNGKDKKSDGSENPGADIGLKSDGTSYGTGNANSTLEGGLIHEAYGGSNQKGVIKGSINQTSNPEASNCELDLRKVVGAGKYADIDQDVNMILSCQPEKKVDVLFAGADEANVNGNITLTITNGNFGQVFGGNNLGGAVKGRIIVNVEEKGCRPINIDELYLCGNNAAYSVYGYYQSDEVHPVTGKKILKPRESSDDERKPVKDYDREHDSWTVYSGEEGNTFTPYDDPVLNVVSCTHIGQVFGGGYGTGAIVYGNPTVNINMEPGDHAETAVPAMMTALNLPSSENTDHLGIIENVYGGGNAADVIGDPTVNIGTESQAIGAYISGNVYGGGKGSADSFTCEKAMIGKDKDGINNPDGGTTVNIYKGFVRGNVYGGGEIGRVEKDTKVTIGAEDGTDIPVIKGDVFGAGKGLETHGYAALVRGNPTVTIQGNAKVLHSVYGGGQIASVARYDLSSGVPVALAQTNGHNSGYCTVIVQGNAEIGPDGMKMYHTDSDGNIPADDKPDDCGHVFAAGKGVLPKVFDYVKPATNVQTNYHTEQYEINDHMPRRMAFYKDKKSEYWEYADPDFDPTSVEEGDLANQDVWEYYSSEKEYFTFIETLALATQTELTIGGKAFVKGSVYGGSENGLVQYDTNVTIQDHCQIGQGKEITTRYEDYTGGNLFELTVPPVKSGSGSDAVYYDLECASWDYDSSSGAPYDPNAKYQHNGKYYYDTDHTKYAEGGSIVGKDGHTYYGNVFGGGSGSVPYFDTQKKESSYIMSAGWVKGDTHVTINGGHILTNVYGGNEATNVDGTAHVTMTDGTIGVPRTLAQIDAHPVTCYLFGAGKGDQRVFFNKDTNVKDVVVNITGGRIYGSVFGGGEDGHVHHNVTMTIGTAATAAVGTEGEEGYQPAVAASGPTIGTWGTSYVDGNVFGGGRGFGGDAYTAGNIAGSVKMEIKGGEVLGSIYGGGRLGSVGYGLFDEGVDGYGEMRPDNTVEESNPTSAENFKRGHIDITISGGTIGNNWEYIVPKSGEGGNTPSSITETDFTKWTSEQWATWKAHNHIPKTEFDASGHLTHTKGGNVFAGGMGRFHKLDGTYISAIDWWKLGCVKSTKLTITGGTIKSNVYGGGELGQVVGHHTTQNAANENINASTEIIIQGSNTQIGTEVKNGGTTEYTFGSVFGGGYGSLTDKIVVNNGKSDITSYPRFIAGLVKEDTKIDMEDGRVKASIYGGGEMASVGESTESTTSGETTTVTGSTYVTVSGGTVGIAPIEVSGTKRYFGGAKMGNVYGGGSGDNGTVRSGKIFKNTNVTISGGTIYHNIYGGGAYGTVGDFLYEEDGSNKVIGVTKIATTGTGIANVTITGGTFGTDGKENGMVFGSSRGDIAEPDARDDYCAYVYDTHVVIGTKDDETAGPQINGSVYGSGENGHTFNDTEVIIHSGTIGIETGSPVNGLSGANYPTRGNVYGGGCGTDTYEVDSKNYFNRLSGIVRGNTSVKMDGGHVVRSIYGGGAMGSVGVFSRSTTDASGIHLPGSITGITSGGKCTIKISGGKVGPNNLTMPMNAGMVFGAGRGEMHDLTYYPNLERVVYVDQTDVTITGTAFIKGSVYGGSESGHVFGNTHVTIDGNCQIGCGYDKTFNNGEGKDLDRVYTTDEWAYDVTSDDTKFLYECNSWPFHAPYTPYDKFAKDTGYYDDAQNQSADNARPQGSDGHTFYGNVFGGGSGFEPYAPGKWLPTAGWVQGNTLVEIKGGHILTSVYGGNEMSDVGSGGVQKMTDLNHETSDMFYDITKPGGKCTVKMSGGTLGVPRTLAQIAAHPLTCYLFGAGKGDQRIFFNKTTNVKEVEIEISGGRIFGSVFGGGEDGHVMRDVKMTIKDGSTTTGEGEQAVTTTTSPIIGTWGTSYVDGNVFGGGRGFSGEALTAGNVGGSVNIDIQGGKMFGSIYGGGRLGSVGYGLYLVDEEINGVKPYSVLRDDNVDDRGNTVEGFKRGYITINISGGTIGNDIEYKYNPTNDDKLKMPTTQFDYQNHLTYTRGGNVFTGCMGRLYALDNSTLLPLWTKLGRCRQTELNITGGMIKSNVYGGAELGVVQENATVNITGGTVGTKVGEGENAYYYGSVFGSGKGSNDAITYPESTDKEDKKDISEAGTVEGNVMVELNKGVAESENKKGGVVHKIFGCNDMNGTPKGTVTVHVYATQKEDEESINDKADKAATAEAGIYDVEAVYGGGNLAAYVPTKAVTGSEEEKQLARCEVIIDGCGLTSIGTVYGGGNAASVPATNVTVYGTYEIGQVFGGGNGKDKLPSGSDNPGANVGYYSYPNAANAAYDTKENRIANYGYGSGKTHATIYGGTVHKVYGGSNKRGNVRIKSRTTLEDGECSFNVGAAYGGGNDAPMDGDAVLEVGCISGMEKAYGGAANADVNGNVELNITNGTYGRVFGGNDQGGAIRGSITVNIEETGCRPIVIGELYGGGNEAAYSVYGYDADGKPLKKGDPGALDVPNANPTVNVKSFTSIGTIYGGGYGTPATMVGSPIVNINVHEGKYYNTFRGEDNVIKSNAKVIGTRVTDDSAVSGYDKGYPVPSHEKGKIGAINNVFGGGNAAAVIGNPTVNIGTEAGEEVYAEVEVKTGTSVENYYTRTDAGYTAATGNAVAGTTYYLKTAKAVDIRGNVYGGGNNADVQGDTNVVIGKKAE